MRKIKARYVILLLLAIIVGITAYFISRMLWVDKSLKFTSSPVENAISSLKWDAKLGGTMELTSENINSILDQQMKNVKGQGDLKIEKTAAALEGDRINLYLFASYKNIKFMITSRGALEYDGNTINYVPEYFKAGKMKLPKNYVMKQLKQYTSVNEGKGRIEFKASFIPVKMQSLNIENSKVVIKFNTLPGLDILKSLIR